MQSRKVGDITVTAITEGIMPWTPELTVPEEVWRQAIDADDEGKVSIDTHVLVVQQEGATILIDAGLDEPGSAWEEGFYKEWPGSVRSGGVVKGLASLGIAPEDVNYILLTHVHFDHVIGLATERDGRLVPRYPNARVLVGRDDWENVPEEHLSPESKARIRAVEEASLLELVDGEREVVPGVTMIPTPGESPGHSMVGVSSNGEALYAVGDLFHHSSEVDHPDWMVPWADQRQMLASRRRLLTDAAPTGALVVFTHESFPPWGRIVGDEASGYRWQRV
jgi:glyoxylase-like metal-dependent hydrolase (beta-lactamase superfamily II)